MAVVSPDVLARMPLAEAVLTMWCWIADDSYLKQIFDQHRGKCYEKILSFPLVVRLIRDALIEHEGSGARASSTRKSAGNWKLPTTPPTAKSPGCQSR